MHPRLIASSLVLGALVTSQAALSAQHQIFSLDGDAIYDELGISVAGVGDVDKDGQPDFAIGAHQIAGIGFVRVHSGADGRVLHTFRGDNLDDTFGRSVARIGDVDKDGFADILVGAPQECG